MKYPNMLHNISPYALFSLNFLIRMRGINSFSASSSSWIRPLLLNSRRPPRRCSSSFRRTTPSMMPEGPEVKTATGRLQPAVGMRLVDIQFVSGRYATGSRPVGFAEFGSTMTPFREDSESNVDIVTGWDCKGKFLWITLDDGGKENEQGDADGFSRTIWITLGMSGRFLADSNVLGENEKHVRWYLEFHDPKTKTNRKVFYRDMRNFGTLKFNLSENALEKKLRGLGLDILSEDEFTMDNFLAVMEKEELRLKKRGLEKNICKFLMDQKYFSGIGNYILAECLYKSNVDPFADLSEIGMLDREALYLATRDTARKSYNSQVRTGDSRKLAELDFEMECYGRKTCAKGETVIRDGGGPHGRSIWYVEDQLYMSREERKSRDEPQADLMEDTGNLDEDVMGRHISSSSDVALDLSQHLKEPGWKEALSSFMSTSQFSDLASFVQKQRTASISALNDNVYPSPQSTFNALNSCPLDQVKVVVIGQDPYHGAGQGHGFAFSVREGVKIPPSLRNIYREATDDVGINPPPHGNLESWSEQGVLLLNSVLTVQQGSANSHSGIGWEEFTDEVVRILNDQKEGLVFLLWGKYAEKKCGMVDESKHIVITTSHPSPLGATKTKKPFIGSRCFSRANAFLEDQGEEAIDWNVV